MTAKGYISGTEEIIKASWSNSQYDGAAAFKLSERSPLLPLRLKRTSLEDELKYQMSAESAESAVVW